MTISRLAAASFVLASFALIVGCTSTVTSDAPPDTQEKDAGGGRQSTTKETASTTITTSEKDASTPEALVPEAACPSGLFTKSTCQSCFATKCKAECGSCGADEECKTALACLNACTTDSCFGGCLDGLSSSSTALLSDILGSGGCVDTKCSAECATTPPPPPPPPPPTLKRTGDACTASSQCESGSCNGTWCTEYCVNNTDCGINSSNNFVWCVPNNAGTKTCFPGCSTNSDCYAFSGTTCKSVTANNGATTHVCSF